MREMKQKKPRAFRDSNETFSDSLKCELQTLEDEVEFVDHS